MATLVAESYLRRVGIRVESILTYALPCGDLCAMTRMASAFPVSAKAVLWVTLVAGTALPTMGLLCHLNVHALPGEPFRPGRSLAFDGVVVAPWLATLAAVVVRSAAPRRFAAWPNAGPLVWAAPARFNHRVSWRMT